MHPIVDRLASHEWDPAEARRLLRGLSSVMADEVEAICGFDAAARADGLSSARRTSSATFASEERCASRST